MIKPPSCQKHQGHAYQFIQLKQGEVGLACGECIYTQQDNQNKVDFSSIISIDKAINSPEILLSKLTGQDRFQNYFVNLQKNNVDDMINNLKQLEQQVNQFQKYLNDMIEKLKQHININKQSREDVKNKILEKIQYNKFNEIMNELINNNQQLQFEIKLSKYIDEVQNGDGLITYITQLIKDRQINLINDLEKKMELNQLTQFVSDLKQQHDKFYQITKGNYQTEFLENAKSAILGCYDFKELIEKVQSKKVTFIQRIQSVLNEQNVQKNNVNIWNEIDNKDNLLFVIRSITNKVFGGFSPCKWQQNLHKYVMDNNLESFIFIQNPDQYKQRFCLYPLKDVKQQYAIYSSNKNGPSFGSGFDLQLDKNLKNAILKIGQCYHVDEQNVNPSCNSNNQIAEIEIFQIL